MWLARHTPEKVLPILHKVVEGVKEEFADAVASGGGIYGIGYCFGAKYIVILGGVHPDPVAWGQAAPEDEEQGAVKKEPLIKAGAIAHGTDIRREDLEAVKVPLCLVCVENDPVFPDEIREAGQKALEENKVEHELKVYPGVPHGRFFPTFRLLHPAPTMLTVLCRFCRCGGLRRREDPGSAATGLRAAAWVDSGALST